MFNYSNREKRLIKRFLYLPIGIFMFIGIYMTVETIFFSKNINTYIEENKQKLNKNSYIHVLDTGNSDCILIKGSKNILIDGADKDDENQIVKYLKKEEIKDIDYLVSTHYHKDHLGALPKVINEFNIGSVYVSNAKSDTKEYKLFRKALKDKGLKRQIPKEGIKLDLGNGEYIKFFNTDGGDYTNDESLIMLYVNNDDKFMFMADAEKKAELENLSSFEEIDVVKIGHHGSESSTTNELLDVLKPKVAIITNSESNKYANPASIVMKRLKERKIEVHRTDECGHIVIESTGNGVNPMCQPGSYRYRTIKETKIDS